MDNKDKNTNDPKFDHLNLDMTNAASTNDFTGLIPSNPQSEDELDSYKDIYNFGNVPDTITKDKAGDDYEI